MSTSPQNTTVTPASSQPSPSRSLLPLILRKKKPASEATSTPSLSPSSSRTSIDSQSTLTTATPCTPLKGSSSDDKKAYGAMHDLPGSNAVTVVPSLPKHSASSPAPSKRRKEDSEPRKAAIVAYSQLRF